MWKLVALELVAELAEVVAGDVDGDGRAEVIAVAELPGKGQPASVRLEVLRMGAGGVESRSSLDLGRKATYWEAQAGLWAVDADGVRGLLGIPVAALPTPLSALGPTTPQRAEIAEDLDGDGKVELIVYSRGRLHVFGSDGAAWGSVAAAAEGALQAREERGGSAVWSTVRPPPWIAADVDGDGLRDLVIPRVDTLAVAFTQRGKVAAREATFKAPFQLEPPPGEEGGVQQLHLMDVDGDRRADLVAVRVQAEESFFEATSELLFSKGSGSGFGAPQVVDTGAGATEVHLVDVDGDRDLDALVPQIDLGFTALGQALVTRTLPISLTLFRFNAGFGAPKVVGTLDLDLEKPDVAWSPEGDVDGDGSSDIVFRDEQEIVLCRGPSFAESARLALPVGVEELLSADLDGDGRAETLGWTRGQAKAVLLVWR